MYFARWKKRRNRNRWRNIKKRITRGVEIQELKYYKTYYDKAVFEKGEDFKQTTYIVTLKNKECISVKNEIKEMLWINVHYEEKGIKCNPTLKLKIIPDLIKDKYFKGGEKNE